MSRWTRVWEAFWLVPTVFCVLAVVLAEAMIAVDRNLDVGDLGPLAELINRVGEAGSRDLLGAIAGSTLSVAATSFSITLAVLATASSTYGPRLVRNFMADRGNQFVLGVFTASFLYSLLVLRSIRSPGDAEAVFVPHLAVNLAVLFGVLTIGVLVYFINHIADSVQVWTLARQVRTDLLDAVDRLCPEELGRAPQDVADPAGRDDVLARLDADGVAVVSREVGYLQSVAEDRLLAAAVEHDLVVALRVRPGTNLIEGTAIAVVWPPERVNEHVVNAVRDSVLVGEARSPRHDVEFAVQVLEEMAVRALSPGTNDPYTALNALDELSAGLLRLARRKMPSPYRYDEGGQLRVVAPRVVLTDLLDSVFDAMRTYAVEHYTVLRRTLELAGQVGVASGAPAVHARLRRHVELVAEAYELSSPQDYDLDRLRQKAAEVEHALRLARG